MPAPVTFPFLYGRTVTVQRATVAGRDSYGNDVLTFTSHDITGCVVWPTGGSSEQTVAQDLVTSGLNVLLPPGTALAATDQLSIDGVTYEVEGEPAVWGPSPFTGTRVGVQVVVKRVTG